MEIFYYDYKTAFLRDSNNSQSVIDIFDRLYLELRPDIFMGLFPVILANNGSEFSNLYGWLLPV